MSASSQQKNTSLAEWVITDPGDGAALPADQSGIIPITVVASTSETNTLALPERMGLDLTISAEAVGASGLRTITVTGGYDETGGTALVLNAAGEFVKLTSVFSAASTLVWRVVAYDGVTGPTNTESTFENLTATGTVGLGTTTVSSTLTLSDGGTVTQATNKGTGVTLSTNSGQITMNNASLAAAAEVTFIVTNTVVAATDVIIVNHGSAGTAGSYLVGVSTVAAGSFRITVANLSAGALGEAIVLNFVVIGGASS